MSSSSSSSSMCCVNPTCIGSGSFAFSNWTMSGFDDTNADNCTLYVVFDNFEESADIQQVEIYKDSAYLELVAIGQDLVGAIELEERNSSGISGTVIWNGTLVVYPATSILVCEDLSSSESSSSASFSSSSSGLSSSSDISSESSSSLCCENPFCFGTSCSHFSNWVVGGIKEKFSSGCILYVDLDYFDDGNQQVRIYKDAARSLLVSIGQTDAITIILEERNGSGISGSVDWDGVFTRTSDITLECLISSSSSVSISSSSSSSSVSDSSSSIDSQSSSSSSSLSSSSTQSSSSSSIDSSSTSSESVGNTSSSSSSSAAIWNETKPLLLGMSAINYVGKIDKLAHSIFVNDPTYSIGKAFCYFYGPFGDSSTFDVYLDIYDGDADGKPATLISTTSMTGSSITEDGWYYFEPSITGITPSTGYLTFVIRQEGGTEDDYVLWGYFDTTDQKGAIAFYFEDGEWVEQLLTLRAIKLVGSFDAYDLDDYRLVTPPATEQSVTRALTGGVYDQTELVEATGTYDQEYVGIDYPDIFISFVIDSSGSMGWNDRFDTRIDFFNQFFSKIGDKYPNNNVLFDIVKFGADVIDSESVFAGLGTAQTANFDLNTPSRKSYVFAVDSASVVSGDVYTHNDVEYTVTQTASLDTFVICTSDTDPLLSGILTKLSGGGDATISFSSFDSTSISDGIIAYGIRDLEAGHTYNIGSVSIDNTSFDTADSSKWMQFSPVTTTSTITDGSNGPEGAASVDIVSEFDTLVTRRPVNIVELRTTELLDDVEAADQQIRVNVASTFIRGENVDLVDGDSIVVDALINSIDSSTEITLTKPAGKFINSNANYDGVMQISNSQDVIFTEGTTLMLEIRDVSVTKAITFYIQTSNGLSMEWDFTPFGEWYVYNMFWWGETAILPVEAFDVNGFALPDLTKVFMYVDKKPFPETNAATTAVKGTALTGSSKMYLADSSPYAVGQIIDIVKGVNAPEIQSVTISAISEDATGDFIEFSPPLSFDVSADAGSKVIASPTSSESSSATGAISEVTLLPSLLSMVDVTPIYTEQSLSPSLLASYDPTPFSPSDNYDTLDLDDENVRSGIVDIPIIDGTAVLRVLPIAEDNLKTLKEKSEDTSLLVNYDQSEEYIITQLIRNEHDDELADEQIDDSTTTTTTPITDLAEIQDTIDYQIDSPVFLREGVTKSSMTTYATDLTVQSFDGVVLPGSGDTEDDPSELLARSYTIYPSIVKERENGSIYAQQYLESFDVIFTPPYVIESDFTGVEIPFTLDQGFDECCEGVFLGYGTKNMPGSYATGDSIGINFRVYYKNALLKNGEILVTIYSSPVVDLEEVVSSDVEQTNSELNVKPAQQFVIDDEGEFLLIQPLTEIDQWRKDVAENAEAKRIESLAEQRPGVSDTNNIFDTVIESFASVGAVLRPDGTTVPSAFTYYDKAQEWVEVSTQIVTVVDGYATLDIDPGDTETLLMVEASIQFGTGDAWEVIHNRLLFVDNPIGIGVVSPSQIKTLGQNYTYEIGTNLTWMGEVIDDNVVVSYAPISTNIAPAISKTDDGWGGGVFLGPHPEVIMVRPSPCADADSCPSHGAYEDIEISSSYLGYTKNVTRKIEWISSNFGEKESGDELNKEPFAFRVTVASSGPSWSDGSDDVTTTINADLSDSINLSGYPWAGEEGRDFLLGEGQGANEIDGSPRFVRAKSDENVTIQSDQKLWQLPDGTASFSIHGVNKNIGNVQNVGEGITDNSPWSVPIEIDTAYRLPELKEIRSGTGSVSSPTISVDFNAYTGEVSYKWVYDLPVASFSEPLGIDVEIESFDSTFARDGIDSPTIVATVTWRGQPITNTLLKDINKLSETGVNISFPIVTFQAGVTSGLNAIVSTDPETPSRYNDTRNSISGALRIASHPDVSLLSYSGTISLSRTDIYIGEATHTHECSVDENGDGSTTSTIYTGGDPTLIPDHTHVIVAYIAQSAGDISHTHALRSVVVTQLDPLVNIDVEIAVNGYVIFDPTNSAPGGFGDDPLTDEEAYGDGSQGNRMMFDSLFLVGSIIAKRELILSLSVESEFENLYAARTVSDDTKAFNLVADASFSAYTVEESPGVFVTVPARKVPDGTRITFDVTSYKPMDASTADSVNNVSVTSPDEIKAYMTLLVKVSVNSDGLVGREETTEIIYSNLQWLPSVRGLLDEPTNDIKWISEAIADIESFGSSQIHDAVKLAAQRIIEFQADNEAWRSSKKAIFLLTDGDENTSEYTIDQAIDNVNFVNGRCETPVMPVKFGFSYRADEVLMAKYAEQTCGNVSYLVDVDSSVIQEAVGEIITSSAWGINEGTYTNTIDLDDFQMADTFAIDSTSIPTGSRMLFRVRFSADAVKWGEWSEWFDSSRTIDLAEGLETRGRYFQYQVRFLGNEDFETPKLLAGLTMTYYKAETFTVFFQPLDLDLNTDEYLASIHITHEGDIPDTSVVNYGYVQIDSTEFDEYYGVTRPLITPDRHTIILSRYNEIMTTLNNRTYYAINGAWAEAARVEIYVRTPGNTKGTLMNVSQYAISPKEGSISFYGEQDTVNKYTVCVYFDDLFRFYNNVTNYGPQQVTIDHIGIMYNVTKRIPVNQDGSIIHVPISERL